MKKIILYLLTTLLSINLSIFAQNNCNVYNITDPINYNSGSMGGYLNYSECLAELDQMATLYPNLITVKTSISNFVTFENRQIYSLKISDNPNLDEVENKILYTALHHSHEPNSMQQLIYYMWYLLENYATNSEIKKLVDNSEIFFIPVLNPDGYIYNQTTNPNGGGTWRKNRRNHFDGQFGVDLNRNYSYQWGNSTTTASDRYCGTSSFSEPETQAIKWICEQKQFKVVMNAHTHGKQIFYPHGYANIQTPDHIEFDLVSEEMCKHNGYTNILSALGGATPGDSDDWMYTDTTTKPKIFAFTPEVGGSYWESSANILKNNKDMVYTNLTALRSIHNYAEFEDITSATISQINFESNYQLRRLGLVNNQNLTVTIVPISNNITSVGVPKTYSNVIFNSVVNDNILVNLNSTIQQGEIIIYNIVVDNGTYLETYQILKIFGNPVVAFTEPANNTNQWTVSNNWTTTSSTFYSPSSSITESPNGNYQDNSQASITINNPINFLNKSFAEISFFAKWNLENNYDYVVIEVSTDNGNTWTAQCGKYTNAGINSQPLNQPLFDGIQNTWVEEKINLNSYLGQTILVRFRFKSDIDTNADGFYFDDFKISTITTPSLSNFMFDDFSTTIYPNPAKDKLSIESNIQFQKFNIVDELGRKILNGKIENNSINTSVLKSGIYVIELQNESYKIVKKIIIEK